MLYAVYSKTYVGRDDVTTCLVLNEKEQVVARGRSTKGKEGALKNAAHKYYAIHKSMLIISLIKELPKPTERPNSFINVKSIAHA